DPPAGVWGVSEPQGTGGGAVLGEGQRGGGGGPGESRGGTVGEALRHRVASEGAAGAGVVPVLATGRRERDVEVERRGQRTPCRQTSLIPSEAAVASGCRGRDVAGGPARDDVHHPAHRVRAIERRGGSPHHLDPFDATELQECQVRRSCRPPVLEDEGP